MSLWQCWVLALCIGDMCHPHSMAQGRHNSMLTIVPFLQDRKQCPCNGCECPQQSPQGLDLRLELMAI